MLKENKLDIGICIIEETMLYDREGVIVENDGIKIGILWFVKYHFIKEKYDYYYSEKDYYSFSEIENLDYAIVPHFCHIKNLYEILEKYSDYGIFKFLGKSELEGMYFTPLCNNWNDGNTDFLYFKTPQNTYLELIICYQYENKEPYIWINECSNINELHINTSYASYYYFANSKNFSLEFQVKNEESQKFYGISFNCEEILISILTYKNNNPNNVKNLNEVKIESESIILLKSKNKKDFINILTRKDTLC